MPETKTPPARDVALIPAARSDMALVAALSRFYVYDIARAVAPALDWHLTRDWLFDPGDWSFYWDAGNHPFLIEADGQIAGFCLIDHRAVAETFDWNMGQFYVLGTLARRGIGARAARLAFERFPGIWQVTQVPENLPAIAFWRAVIGAHTGGRFDETVLPDPQEEGEPRNVMLFTSPA
jgi:predicted acetyltransferase